MISRRILLAALLVALAAPAPAQVTTITLIAGSPEDQATNEITRETDAQKRLALIQDALQKFSANPMAAAWFQWQLAQHYQNTSEWPQALAAGEKAIEAQPNNVEIMVTVAQVAQSAKDWATVSKWATRAGTLINTLDKQPRPEGASPEEFTARVRQQQSTLQPLLEFLEAAAYTAVANEPDPKKRMGYVEQFPPAFPNSKFAEPVAQYAIVTLQQLNDPVRLQAFGEKVLAANPESVSTLTLLATAFAEDQTGASLTRAITLGRKGIELAKPRAPDADDKRKLQAGLCYSAIGFALMRQEKTLPAITDLREAAALLKGGDPAAYQTALFRLGYAYAKLSPPRLTEARAALTEAASLQGPFQQAARDLLAKVNARRAGR